MMGVTVKGRHERYIHAPSEYEPSVRELPVSLQALLDLALVGRANAPGLDDATASRASTSSPTTYRFGDVEARANATARLLRARGFVAGDRLAFFLPNRIEVIDLYLACVRLGV